VLKRIDQTTDPFNLRGLARTLQALPVRLSEAKAQQALDPMLKQIGQRTDPSELQILAQALQALPVGLTDAQAQQALGPVVEQVGQNIAPGALGYLARRAAGAGGQADRCAGPTNFEACRGIPLPGQPTIVKRRIGRERSLPFRAVRPDQKGYWSRPSPIRLLRVSATEVLLGRVAPKTTRDDFGERRIR